MSDSATDHAVFGVTPDAAVPPAARPAAPRPRPAAAPPARPGKPPETIEEIEDIEEIDEVADGPADESAADDRPTRVGFFSRDGYRETFRSLSCTGVSAGVHMLILVILSLVLGEIVDNRLSAPVTFDVEEVVEPPTLLKIELEPELELAMERTSAVSASSDIIGEAAASVSSGGSGGSGSSGSFGSGPGPAGSGSGLGAGLDAGVFNRVGRGNGRGDGIGDGIGDVVLNLPSSRTLITAAPDGQIGEARAIVKNYEQALDRVTQEIMWMLDKGPVLVVWAFDQSESMKDDQKEIRDRFEHVYDQLGLLGSTNGDALQTAICSYGEKFLLHTKEPTSNRDEIRAAISEVPNDPSGKEMMCSTVLQAIGLHRSYAQRTRRQMAMIIVTDETGERVDNDSNLERAIAEAKAARCKIYVMGREAVFGYPYAHLRWVHPQTQDVHWIAIDRGPESAFVEQLQTNGFHRRYDAHPSGFGPFECTRLGQESGGIFFMLPSPEVDLVGRDDRDYELEAMRPYIPDMRSKMEVKADIDKSPMRSMLETVIYDLNPYNPKAREIIEMRVEFSTDPAAFVRQARQEQAKAIVYINYLAAAEKTVAKMERARKDEPLPRWQANYDLLYAQLVAYQARMFEYGAYLEEFMKKPKTAPQFRPPNLIFVSWDIHTRKEIITGDKVQPYIDRATAMFQRVIADHPGTPWAARAEIELGRGFGVHLLPDYHVNRPPYTGSAPLIPVPKM